MRLKKSWHNKRPGTVPFDGESLRSLIDSAKEEEIRELLIQHYAPTYQERVTGYVNTLLAVDHYASRFLYLQSVLGDKLFYMGLNLFVSGFSVGSEMVTARYFGFGKIHGVEVDEFLVKTCKDRLHYFPYMYPCLYGGDYLPYASNQFHVVTSGHVIEHTLDPALYLRECLRILVPDGYLALEFPNRFHRYELHTNMPSLEWMPRLLRNACIRLVSSQASPLSDHVKHNYRVLIDTNIQQISIMGIKNYLRRDGQPFKMIDVIKASPGIIRCIIQKKLP